ncbi:hypothetical protein PtB15_18B16 [Puccinia triticina]|nr:hypothetical protein PtB15_18B16 [Puccinia triticina]
MDNGWNERIPPTPPNRNHFIPRSPHPIPLSRSPSPIARDDIIEGMSASTGSIFERDVEHFDASLTAQEAIQLAVPPVLDEAIEALATVSPENILVDQMPLQYHLFHSSLPPNPIHPPASPPPNPLPTPAYPFPQLSPSPPSSFPPIPPRLHHQTLSCTSDTASISDPSSPRSLSPTPSFKIGRSMVTQLTTDLDAIATNHPAEISISTNALLKNKEKNESAFLPAAHSGGGRKLRQRKTCISFMSYVDVLNSERADQSSADPAVPSTSAMNALRMARKSTSSLVNSPNENLGKAWVNRTRSRCTSTQTTYHQPSPSQPSAPNHLLPLDREEAEAEVLGELNWN